MYSKKAVYVVLVSAIVVIGLIVAATYHKQAFASDSIMAYYVDPQSAGGLCSDSGTGTLVAPFCTVNKAITAATPGTTIYLRAATYPPFEIKKSGTSNAYITITNYGGEEVIIDGKGTASQAVSIRSASYIKIKGLKVTGAVGNYDGGIRVQFGQYNIIDDNTVYSNRGTNTHGIIVYDSSYTTISNNTVYNNYLSGIAVTDSSNSGATMVGNIISDNKSFNNTNAVAPGNADGIKLSGTNHTGALIKGNAVHSNGDDGIDTWISHHHTIVGNIVYNHKLAGDGNGIKAGGEDTGGYNIIKFNRIYNNKANGITSNGSGGNEIYHNVVYANGKHGIEDGWRKNACTVAACASKIVGNIGINNVTSNMSANTDTGSSHNNLWYDTTAKTARIAFNYVIKNSLADFYAASGNKLENPALEGKSSIVADPLFVNLSQLDLRLQSTSPAIDKGDLTNPANVVVVGNGPDIGVFETPTLAPEPDPVSDSTPPVVSITAPLNGATLQKKLPVNIAVSATDNVGVVSVKFLINNTENCTDTVSPYTCTWRVNRAGSYTIKAVATDKAGNVSESSITVKVN